MPRPPVSRTEWMPTKPSGLRQLFHAGSHGCIFDIMPIGSLRYEDHCVVRRIVHKFPAKRFFVGCQDARSRPLISYKKSRKNRPRGRFRCTYRFPTISVRIVYPNRPALTYRPVSFSADDFF